MLAVESVSVETHADTFSVSTPGTLEQLVNAASNDSITELTVTGKINWQDLRFIRSCDGRVKALQVIDLSNATIEVSEDSCYSTITTYGDILGSSATTYYYYSNNAKKTYKSKSSGLGGAKETKGYYDNDLAGLFYDMTTLREVKLPSTISNIGERCFAECTSLESVSLANSNNKYIGEAAFSNCEKLKFTIPNNLDSIGSVAFYKCKSLQGTLDLQNVRNIDPGAFKYTGFSKVILSKYDDEINDFDCCENLVSVESPSPCNLKSLGGFEYCTSLKSIVIPEGVTYISGFRGCSALTDVTIPSSVVQVGYCAFFETPFYESLKRDDGFYVMGNIMMGYDGNGTETELITPEGVSYMMDDEFPWKNCESVKKLVFREGFKIIPGYALNKIYWIEELTIPKSVEKITSFTNTFHSDLFPRFLKKVNYNAVNINTLSMFEASKTLEEVVFGDDVETIPYGMFMSASKLTKVKWPSSLKRIGEDAFYNTGITDATLPSTVEYIGNRAFARSGITNISLPNSIDSIGYYAFENCSSLTSVNYNITTKKVGEGLFQNCSNLKEFVFGESVKEIGDGFFQGSKIPSVTLPSSLKVIGEKAFYKSCLTKVELPASLDSIGSSAFSQCDSLKGEITIPETLKYLGTYAFGDCANVTSVNFNYSAKEGGLYAFQNCEALKEVTIGGKVTTLPEKVFSQTGITSVVIPENVDSIGFHAFYGCNSLKTVDIRANVKYLFSLFSQLTSLETVYYNVPNAISCGSGKKYSHMFDGCVALKEIIIGESVKRVPDYLLCTYDDYWNTYLGEEETPRSDITVTLPSSLETIGQYAFAYSNLTAIKWPANTSLKTIGEYAFAYSKIAQLTLPESLDSIGAYMAFKCDSLQEVTVPTNVKSVPQGAFSLCSNLNTLYYNATTQDTSYPFSSCANLKKVVVGEKIERFTLGLNSTSITDVEFENPSIMTYIDGSFVDTEWRKKQSAGVTYVGKVAVVYNSASTKAEAGESDVAEVKEGTVSLAYGFAKDQSLTSVSLPQSLEEIGAYAFYGCTALSSVTIPEKVTTIDEYTFYGCSNLASITLPQNLQGKLGDSSFEDCDNLKSLVIPDGVTEIGQYAIRSCNNLAKLTLPKSLKVISPSILTSCYNISDVYNPSPTPATIINERGEVVKEIYSPYYEGNTRINLHVLESSYSTYCATGGWNSFTVVGDYKDADGIESVVAGNGVKVADGGILVDSDGSVVNVYDIDGRVVFSGNSGFIALTRGLYLVKVDGKTMKVSVK